MSILRRDLLLGALSAPLVLHSESLLAAANKLELRLWPAEDSTRISLESGSKISYSMTIARNQRPYRVILDIKGLKLSQDFAQKLRAFKPRDQFVSAVRAGQYKRDVVRVVFEIKKDACVRAHAAKPIAGYAYRLILEIESPSADPMDRVVSNTSVRQSRQAASSSNRIVENKPQPAPKKPPVKRGSRPETLIVVIDPGHGGEDPGAVGRTYKTYEKRVALQISQMLAQNINGTRGMKAIMTRNRDVFIPLYKRAGIAVKNRAHLFISVHADAWTKASAHGSSVFTLSIGGASSLQARWLAQTQNRSDEIGGLEFKNVAQQARSTVVDMLAETKLRYGMQLGGEVLGELSKVGTLHHDTVESAQFAVLKAQGVPSILVETGFLSNPYDEKRLRDPAYQKRIANAIFRGICNAVQDDPSLLRGA